MDKISVRYANKLGVPTDELSTMVGDKGGWIGSWKKNPTGRFIGNAYTHYAIIWDNLRGTSKRVAYYHNDLHSNVYLIG